MENKGADKDGDKETGKARGKTESKDKRGADVEVSMFESSSESKNDKVKGKAEEKGKKRVVSWSLEDDKNKTSQSHTKQIKTDKQDLKAGLQTKEDQIEVGGEEEAMEHDPEVEVGVGGAKAGDDEATTNEKTPEGEEPAKIHKRQYVVF